MAAEPGSDGALYPDLPAEDTAGEPMDVPKYDPQEELRAELSKTEEEINTLRQVLHAKENYASELRKKLGMTPLSQISNTFKQELNKVQSSNAYKKTSETLKSASQSTASALSNFGSSMSQKFSDMKNSQAFKSFEEKVEGVGSSLMAKVSGSGPEKQADIAEEASETTPVTTQPQQGETPTAPTM